MNLMHPVLAIHVYGVLSPKETKQAWYREFKEKQPAALEYLKKAMAKIPNAYDPEFIDHIIFLWAYFRAQGVTPRTMTAAEIAKSEKRTRPMHRMVALIMDESIPAFLGWERNPPPAEAREAMKTCFEVLTDGMATAAGLPITSIEEDWATDELWKAYVGKSEAEISKEFSKLEKSYPTLINHYRKAVSEFRTIPQAMLAKHQRALVFFFNFFEQTYGEIPTIEEQTLLENTEYLVQNPQAFFPHQELIDIVRGTWNKDANHDFKLTLELAGQMKPLYPIVASLSMAFDLEIQWDDPIAT